MIVDFFKRSPPASVLIIVFFALAFWFDAFTYPSETNNYLNSMPFFEWTSQMLDKIPFLKLAIAWLLLMVEAFYINQICDSFNLLSKKTNLPAFLYVMLMSNCHLQLGFHVLLPANLFLLFGINKLIGTSQKDQALGKVFDAGFCIGIASLFYFPALAFFPIVWVTLIVIRTFEWREWVLSFIGLILPYLFVFTYYFWQDKLGYFFDEKIFFPSSSNGIDFKNEPISFILLSIVLVFFSLLTLFKASRGLPDNTIFARNIAIVFSWFAILSFLAFFMAPEANIKYLSFLSIPLSIYGTHYFITVKKNWWGELIMLTLVVTIFLNLLYE